MKRTFLSFPALAFAALAVVVIATSVLTHGGGLHAGLGLLTLAPPQGLSADGMAMIGFGGLILNPANFRMLEQGFKASFMKGLGRTKANHTDIALTVPSTTSENVYAWLADNFQIREWIGERQMQNLATYGYSIPNKDFEGTVKVKSNAIKDDQYGIYGPLFEQMGDSTNLFPGKLVYQGLKAGAATPCYDGQYFFDTDHPVGLPGKEVSVSNHLGGASAAWYVLCTKKVLKPMIWQPREDFQMVLKDRPTDDNVFFQNEFVYGVNGRCNVGYGLWQLAVMSKQTFDPTNIRAALTAMSSQLGNNGEPLDIVGDTLVVPPTLYETANDLNTKEFLSNGETNTLRGRFTVISTAWVM